MERCRASAHFRLIVFICVGALLTSCGPPQLGMFGSSVHSEGKNGPPIELFVAHLRCEAYRTVTDAYVNRENDKEAWTTVKYLYWYGYQAAGQLTLDVTKSEGFNPSVSDIVPFSKPMTNFTLTVSGQLSGTQHRNVQQNITIDYTKLFDRTGRPDPQDSKTPEIVPRYYFPANQYDLKKCIVNDGTGIQGDLGLADTVALGLGAFREQDAAVAPGFPGAGGAGGPSVTANVFGSTVDFTISAGLNVGPNWTLTHFKGPTGGGGSGGGGGGGGGGSASTSGSGAASQGLLAGTRTAKDTLLISFAPSCHQPGFPGPSAKAPAWEAALKDCVLARAAPGQTGPTEEQRSTALKGATTNNTQILLQDIIPSFFSP